MKISNVLTVVLVAMAFLFSPSTFAARAYSMSIVYFDANNNIIGQSAAFCNNVTMHGGVIDPTNPYHITVQGGCGDLKIHCEPGDLGANCDYLGRNYDVKVTYYRSATGLPMDTVCNTLVICNSREPVLAEGYGFYFSRGFQ